MTEVTVAPQGADYDELSAMLAQNGLISATPPAADEVLVEDEPTETVEAQPIDDLEAAIAELGIEAAPTETVEVSADEVSDADLAALDSELAAAAAKAEVYAEQTSETDVALDNDGIPLGVPGSTDASAEAPKAAKPKKAKKTDGEASASPVPRTSRLAGTTHGAYVAAKLGEDIEAAVADLPKKVKDKAANLADHLTAGKALSIYTRIAVDMLRNDGVISNAKLVEALQANGKKDGSGTTIGTARSQAGQMMSLFGKLGITRPDGSKGLVPNTENAIWQKLAA